VLEPINVDALSAGTPNARSSSPVSYISDDENQVRIALQIMHIYELK
jgi:hypothetical protein